MQVFADRRYYVVRFTTYFTTNPRYKYFNSTDLNCLIDDLKPNTQYEFSVKVVKGKKESTWSLSVLNTTHEAGIHFNDQCGPYNFDCYGKETDRYVCPKHQLHLQEI